MNKSMPWMQCMGRI